MQLGLEQIKNISMGAVRVTQEQDGFHFYRFTSIQEELYRVRSDDFYKKTFSTSGIQLAFKTNSSHLYLKVSVSAGSSRKYFAFEVFIDGKRIGTIDNFSDVELPQNYVGVSLPLGEFEKKFSLGDGEKEVRIYLPWSVNGVIKEFDIDDGAFIEPLKYDKKLLCFGDSITHGYDALFPSHKYASRLARFLNAEEFNKAIGGEIFFPELAKSKEDFVPDYITVAYGTNDWNRVTREEFTQNCKDFFANLCANYPESKIFAITPIWRKDYKEERPFGEFKKVEQIIISIIKDIPNAVAISGVDFIEHDEKFYADLRLHPNDQGFAQYFESLAKQIS